MLSRRAVIIVVTLLLIATVSPLTAADPDELPAPSYVIDFSPPVLRFSPIAKKTRVCGSDEIIEACTGFRKEQLSCECRMTTTGWAIAPTARATPIVYLFTTSTRVLDHENQHIQDIRQQLGLILEKLSSLRFESREGCQKTSQYATREFSHTMGNLRFRSQQKYH